MNIDTSTLLDEIYADHSETLLSKGEILIEPDQSLDCLYYLKKGSLRQYAITSSGDEVTINLFEAPAIVPLMVILSEKENIYYVSAATKATVIAAPKDEILAVLQHYPLFWRDLATRFSSAIYGLAFRMTSLTSTKQKEQLYTLLKYFAKSQEESDKKKITLENKISHSELASWLGCARETVTRLLKQLEKDKQIKYKSGHIVVFFD